MALLLPGALFAQVNNIDSVTVTVIRLEQHPSEAARSVSVITSEDIKAMPVQTVEDVLRLVAGVNLNSRGAFGVQTDIGMRGSTFSQILILIDNVRLNDPLTAHFNSYIPIALSEIAQIEIIRGPAAAAYGADAVGGLIHIKSKTYVNSALPKQITHEGSFAIGQYGLGLTDMSLRGGNEKWIYSLGVKQSAADGKILRNPNFAAINTADSTYSNHFNLTNYTASASYTINSAWRINSRIALDERSFGAKYFYTASIYDESEEDVNSFWSQTSIQRTKADNKTELNIAYKKGTDHFVFNPLFAPNDHTTSKWYANITQTQKWTKQQLLLFGAQSEYKTIESNDRGNHQQLTTGVYAILKSNWNKWHTQLSLRLENDQSFGTEFIPQFAVLRKQKSHVFRASAGKGIRAADFTERFVSNGLPVLSPGRNVGNPDLRAERSISYDIGYDYYGKDNFKINSSIFYRLSDQLIDYVLTNSNQILNVYNLDSNELYLYASNLAKSSTLGFEFSASKTFRYTHGELRPGINYSYFNTNIDSNQASKYLANHPKQIINASVYFSYKRVFLSVTGNYISRNAESITAINAEIPASYTLINALIAVDIIKKKAQLFVQTNNIFNTEYQEILGASMPGRWFLAGFKWSI